MKHHFSHLFLRRAFLPGLVLTCAMPSWAGEPVTDNHVTQFSGDQSSGVLVVSPDSNSEYTLKADSDGTSGTFGTLGVSQSLTLNIDSFNSLQINNILVESNANLTVNIAAGTSLTLSNINFTGTSTVRYVLGEGSSLYVSANDCRADSISGSGTVYFTGGVLDGSASAEPGSLYFVDYAYSTIALIDEYNQWAAAYSSSSPSITYGWMDGAVLNVNGPGDTGGTIRTSDGEGFVHLDWEGKGGYTPIPLDAEVSLPSTSSVPEPATATLSLLALTALAARRRRK